MGTDASELLQRALAPIAIVSIVAVSCGGGEVGNMAGAVPIIESGSEGSVAGEEASQDSESLEEEMPEESSGSANLQDVLISAAGRSRELGFSFEQSTAVDLDYFGDTRNISSSTPTAIGQLLGNDFMLEANLGELMTNDIRALPDYVEGDADSEGLLQHFGEININLWVEGDRIVVDMTEYYEAFSIFQIGTEAPPPLPGVEIIHVPSLTNRSEFEVANLSGGGFSGIVPNPSGLLEVVESLADVLDESNEAAGSEVLTGVINYRDYQNILGLLHEEQMTAFLFGTGDIPFNQPFSDEVIELYQATMVEVAVTIDDEGLLTQVVTEVDLGNFMGLQLQEKAPSFGNGGDNFEFIIRTTQVFDNYGAELVMDIPSGVDRTEFYSRD